MDGIPYFGGFSEQESMQKLPWSLVLSIRVVARFEIILSANLKVGSDVAATKTEIQPVRKGPERLRKPVSRKNLNFANFSLGDEIVVYKQSDAKLRHLVCLGRQVASLGVNLLFT